MPIWAQRKISLNIENISFFASVLEKIIVILPTGDETVGRTLVLFLSIRRPILL
jgi:hypothetical protein